MFYSGVFISCLYSIVLIGYKYIVYYYLLHSRESIYVACWKVCKILKTAVYEMK